MPSGGTVWDRSRIQPRTPNTPTIRPSSTVPGMETSGGLRSLGLGRNATDQERHALGNLRAVLGPVLDAGLVHHELLLATGGHRVVVTQALDVMAVARPAVVGRHHVVERPLLRACARQSDLDHVCST